MSAAAVGLDPVDVAGDKDALSVNGRYGLSVRAAFGREVMPFEKTQDLSVAFDRFDGPRGGEHPSHPGRPVAPLDAIDTSVQACHRGHLDAVSGFEVGGETIHHVGQSFLGLIKSCRARISGSSHVSAEMDAAGRDDARIAP